MSGRYSSIRNCLDYTFHKVYSKERQLLQDAIIYKEIDEKKVYNKKRILLTAGAMGSGKTHTVKRLLGEFYDDYVMADVDRIKHCLPEMKELLKTDPKNAGTILHSEACTIHEIMFRSAIMEGRNVIIDGSLRDGKFFLPFLKQWKDVSYEITIIHVVASLETCLRRAEKRAQITCRYIPEQSIRTSLEQCPKSVELLRPHVDHVIVIHNEIDDA
jgi:predicted ABC-type ATPase